MLGPIKPLLICDAGEDSNAARKCLESHYTPFTEVSHKSWRADRYLCPTLLVRGTPHQGLEAIQHVLATRGD